MLLGLAHIHRAMQRKTENRHGHIIRVNQTKTLLSLIRSDAYPLLGVYIFDQICETTW
jgi:hypothetical protein